MKHLGIYVPMDRRQALAHGESLPDRTTGAALFADVSGFTPLTEALLDELGPQRGAEQLSRQLNTIYAALIAQVDWHRGSVITFSGDAITCWLDGDVGQRAVTCALAMQTAMRPFATVTTPSGRQISMAIKIAVTTGLVRRFMTGNPEIQLLDTLAGAILDRLMAAEQQADKGEIVVSAEVADHLADNLIVHAWRTDSERGGRYAVVGGLKSADLPTPWSDLTPETFADEQVRPWLLRVVYNRLQSGQSQFLAELRPAVILFARFGGIDYDTDEAVYTKLDDFIRWAQGVIERYAGALLQLTIGDKGSYFYAAFGAPIAHADDSARAVAAALALRDKPPEFNYTTRLQIGISQGRVWAGPYGGLTRRTYGVLGDEVNVAARLMGVAKPGEILISQRVAEAVERRYALHPVGPVPVKGKREPVPVFLVVDPHLVGLPPSQNLFTTPLVGRQAELEQMREILER